MNRTEFDNLEIEANAMTHNPVASTHHIHFPRGYSREKLLRILDEEALDQHEAGQNLGAFPYRKEPYFPKID